MTILDRLRLLDSCAISDSLDSLGFAGAIVGLHGVTLPEAAICGRVRTVQAAPRSAEGPQAHIAAALVDEADPGDVVVIANDGRTDVSCWGGLLGAGAVRRGITGVIIDGAFRDIQENADLGLPVFARAAVAISARSRIVQQSMDQRITVAGVDVHSGDWVIADRSGIAFIRGSAAETVVAFAERVVARERDMLQAVLGGRSVADVMHDSKFPVAQ